MTLLQHVARLIALPRNTGPDHHAVFRGFAASLARLAGHGAPAPAIHQPAPDPTRNCRAQIRRCP